MARYPLNFLKTFDENFLFWLDKFIRYKLTNLSNSKVKDKEVLSQILQDLKKGSKDIEELKDNRKKARNIGLTGINLYINPLEKLYLYFKHLGYEDMKEIDEEVLSDFLATETSSLSDATKKNYRIALMAFFGFIDKQNEEDNNISYRYGIELKNWGGLSGKSGTKLPSFLNEDEIQMFIEALDSYEFSEKVADRNRLIIKIILFTGIRISEALSLKTKDFHNENDLYILQIRGKGNKPRTVMIKKNIIQKHLDNYIEIKNNNNPLLITNLKGNMITQAYISRLVEKILISIGIRKEKNGAHLLRHSFATLLYKKHKDLVLVQEVLGHSDINTSRIYTHFDKEKLIKTTDIIS